MSSIVLMILIRNISRYPYSLFFYSGYRSEYCQNYVFVLCKLKHPVTVWHTAIQISGLTKTLLPEGCKIKRPESKRPRGRETKDWTIRVLVIRTIHHNKTKLVKDWIFQSVLMRAETIWTILFWQRTGDWISQLRISCVDFRVMKNLQDDLPKQYNTEWEGCQTVPWQIFSNAQVWTGKWWRK